MRRGQHLPEQVHYEEESSFSKVDGCCKGEGELLLQERADKQINFDGKLLTDLGGFGKVNRLVVVAAQEKDNQLLCVTKTYDSTGKTEAEAVGKTLEDWGSLPPAELQLCKPKLPPITDGSTQIPDQ